MPTRSTNHPQHKCLNQNSPSSAVVAVAHEMARIMYFMLVRGEPYRGENRGLTESKLKNRGKRALEGLRN